MGFTSHEQFNDHFTFRNVKLNIIFYNTKYIDFHYSSGFMRVISKLSKDM